MFRYANPHDFETGGAEGGQVDDKEIILDMVDEFDGKDVGIEDWRLLSRSNIYQGYP